MGEPLDLLFSLLLRLEFEDVGNGLMETHACAPARETEALARAMTRVQGNRAEPDDKVEGDYDSSTFLAVFHQVLGAAHVLMGSAPVPSP